MGDLLLFAAAEQDLSIFAPASPQAEHIRSLSLLVFAISAFILIVVEGVLAYCIWRFWRRRATTGTEPPQVYGSKPIEIAWTAAPTMIVFILILVITRTLWQVEKPKPAPQPGDRTLLVTVIGHQWWWEYVYEYYDGRKLNFITANELHVPASTEGKLRPVYLTLKSADVCHSFWVPRLAGKTDLIPGRTNTMWFDANQPGLFVGQCAEYCGTQHANMLLRVKVDEPAEFERWLANEARPAAQPDGGDAKVVVGHALFLGQSCINCHRVRGTPASGTFGPDLTHLMSRQTLAAGMIPNNQQNLRRWLLNPQQVKPGCLMPAFGLSSSEFDRIVDYLATLR
jgi:cytochrome c oxidase subunit II